VSQRGGSCRRVVPPAVTPTRTAGAAGPPARVIRIGPTVLLALGAISLGACAPSRLNLPVDPGTPLADAAAIHLQVSDACRGVRTLTAVLRLSGRAGEEGVRGTVHAGFRRPGSMRLEGEAPFGAPAFVLAATGTEATLVLPRDRRVVRGAQAADILGALTGVELDPADLLAILTGCVVPEPRASGGRLHDGGMASIDLESGARLYLQRAGDGWRVRAARRGAWQVEYPEWPEGALFPRRVQLHADTPIRVDLRADVSQVQTNQALDDETFVARVPPDAEPLSLEELRRAGPLREAGP